MRHAAVNTRQNEQAQLMKFNQTVKCGLILNEMPLNFKLSTTSARKKQQQQQQLHIYVSRDTRPDKDRERDKEKKKKFVEPVFIAAHIWQTKNGMKHIVTFQ